MHGKYTHCKVRFDLNSIASISLFFFLLLPLAPSEWSVDLTNRGSGDGCLGQPRLEIIPGYFVKLIKGDNENVRREFESKSVIVGTHQKMGPNPSMNLTCVPLKGTVHLSWNCNIYQYRETLQGCCNAQLNSSIYLSPFSSLSLYSCSVKKKRES